MRRLLPWALAPLLGCATVSPKQAFSDVATTVEQRTGQRIHWDAGGPADEEVARRIRARLSEKLTADAAVEVALLGNRLLQATYEELGVAQADLVQAGLLRNPVLFGSLRLPGGPGVPKTEFSIAQEFLDLFMLPLRKKVAEQELERAQLRVAHAVLELSAQVREAFYRLQASQQTLALRRQEVEAADASAELARRQYEAGNISELDFSNEEALSQQARLDLARSEAETFAGRERLNRLLGLWGAQTEWALEDTLPELPKEDPPLEHLESLAISQRLDLAAVRKETGLLAGSVELSRGTRLLGSVTAGVSTEREVDGTRVTGPTLSLELPLFDQHQASVARLESQLREAQRRQEALAIDIRSEARAARFRLQAARALVEHYRTVLVPLRQRVVALSQRHYNAMLLGVYQLLLARQNEVNTRRESIESLRDYWIAHSDLEQVIGGRLPPAAPASGPTPSR